MNNPLPQDYYRRNVATVVAHTAELYPDLLSEEERAFTQRFANLSEDGQKLLARMLLRKGEDFRADKLLYEEIHSLQRAAEELAAIAFIKVNAPLPANRLAPLFTVPEWRKQLGNPTDLSQCKRDELDDWLEENWPSVSPPKNTIYSLQVSDHFDVCRLCFFGNLTQDFSEFVLRDLGLFHYDTSGLSADTRLFTTRTQIDAHLAFYALRDELSEATTKEACLNLLSRLPKMGSPDPLLSHRMTRAALQLARQLERLECFPEAEKVYNSIDHPDARERYARVLAKMSQVDDALAFCHTLATGDAFSMEREFARSFGSRLAKKHDREWPFAHRRYTPKTNTISIPHGHSVERAAAVYFQNEGDCFYVENTLFCGLFGLSFWQVIFAPVRGAFTHPFQRRPHDFYEHDFLQARETWLNKAWKHIKSEHFLTHILRTYKEKQSYVNPFVHWPALSEDIINTALNNIPREHLVAIFQRMWADIRQHRNGFPDLILFPQSGHYRLIEVKGPGDRLQNNQQGWMRFFHEHDIPHQVVNVTWQTESCD